MIKKIIEDFDNNVIPSFFDLNQYDTDYEIIRKFGKFLRIGYILKENINDPSKAIYINFNRKIFTITTVKGIFSENIVFEDKYINYNNTQEIYDKILFICEKLNN